MDKKSYLLGLADGIRGAAEEMEKTAGYFLGSDFNLQGEGLDNMPEGEAKAARNRLKEIAAKKLSEDPTSYRDVAKIGLGGASVGSALNMIGGSGKLRSLASRGAIGAGAGFGAGAAVGLLGKYVDYKTRQQAQYLQDADDKKLDRVLSHLRNRRTWRRPKLTRAVRMADFQDMDQDFAGRPFAWGGPRPATDL
jgi:hypothetical protein